MTNLKKKKKKKEPCKVRETLINLNPNEPPYYSFVSLDKCDGSCNSRVATERIN